MLAKAPIDIMPAVDRLAPVLYHARDSLMRIDAFRDRRDAAPERRELLRAHICLAAAIVVVRQLEAGPRTIEPIGLVRLVSLARLELAVEELFELPDPRFEICTAHDV